MEDPVVSTTASATSASGGSNNSTMSTEALLKKLHEVSDRGVKLVRKYASIDPSQDNVMVDVDWDDDDDVNPDDEEGRERHRQHKSGRSRLGEQPNPWKDPETMLMKLKQVRDELTSTWMALEEQQRRKVQQQEEEEKEQDDGGEPDENQLRVLYMDMVTDAFGDVLDHMRQQESSSAAGASSVDNAIDVDLLVDCLQNGMDFLDPSERNKQFLDDFEAMDDDNENDGNDDDDDGDDDSDDMGGLTCHQVRQQEIGYIGYSAK